ncbi:MAG: response regulator [Polyangiales bacterium]
MAEAKILVVDDELPMLETYRDALAADGFTVDTAQTAASARERFGDRALALIVIDQKLHGPSGPDEGLDLIAEAIAKNPGAKVIIATAYAEERSLKRAFAQGVYDYLKKDELFVPLLRAKARNVMELWRERARALHARDERERELREAWSEAQRERDNNKKGKLLETALLLLFRSIDGFETAWANRQNDLEEIDVFVQNNSTDPLWSKEGAYILVECKHWSKPVGTPEIDLFWQKIERRFGRSALGFFIAMGGFASTVKIEQLTHRRDRSLVIMLTRDDVERLVAASDRNAELKKLHASAVIADSP